MRFSINKIELVNELGLFQGILEKKNTIPMLSNVLIVDSRSEWIAEFHLASTRRRWRDVILRKRVNQTQ